jgi:hypothetical protein
MNRSKELSQMWNAVKNESVLRPDHDVIMSQLTPRLKPPPVELNTYYIICTAQDLTIAMLDAQRHSL